MINSVAVYANSNKKVHAACSHIRMTCFCPWFVLMYVRTSGDGIKASGMSQMVIQTAGPHKCLNTSC